MDDNKIYDQINERILSMLEAGVSPWKQPWKNGQRPQEPVNLISKKPYRGVNFFILSSLCYQSPYWATFNQIKSKGGNVKKGEKGTMVVFWKILDIQKENEKGEKKNASIPLLRYFYVFNVEQCEGLNIEPIGAAAELVKHNLIDSCEKIKASYPLGMPELRHNETKAFYNPRLDYINMPKDGYFKNMEEYYHTFFHESIHATGHKSRLNRDTLNDIHFWGDPVYSQEELVAELGASYLSNAAGIENSVINNSASYIQGWLNALRNDKKMFFKAASSAQKAVDYLLNVKFEEKEE